MSLHGRDRFGNKDFQITSTLGISMNSNPLFLTPGNDFPCVFGSLVWNKSERAHTTFLDVRSCPSFLVASGYLSLFVIRPTFFGIF